MSEVPRWLELQFEIDFVLWQLEQLRSRVAKRSALDLAIDAATGHEEALAVEAEALMDRHQVLLREFEESV